MLSNPGNTKFEIENWDAGNSWAFTNSGADFRISLQDSGLVEFRVDNSGDAFLSGTLTQNSDVQTGDGKQVHGSGANEDFFRFCRDFTATAQQ